MLVAVVAAACCFFSHIDSTYTFNLLMFGVAGPTRPLCLRINLGAAACGELSELQHGATPLQAPDAKTKLSLASRMAVSLQAQSSPVRRHGFR